MSVRSLTDTPEERLAWVLVEGFIVLNYLIDFLVKLFTCPRKTAFLVSHVAIVDYFSIIPFVIEVSLYYDADEKIVIYILRVLKMARFLRLLTVLDDHREMTIFLKAVRSSQFAVFFLFFFVLCVGTFYAACIFYAELSICKIEDGQWVYDDPSLGSLNGTPSQLQNILDAFWWSIVTMATVGYGDVVPHSTPGKLVAGFAIFTAIIFINLPMAIFSANLTQLYLERRMEVQAKKRAKQLMKKRMESSFTAPPIDDSASVVSLKSFKHERLGLVKTRSLIELVDSIKLGKQDLEESLAKMKDAMEMISGQSNHLNRLIDQVYSTAFSHSDPHDNVSPASPSSNDTQTDVQKTKWKFSKYKQ